MLCIYYRINKPVRRLHIGKNAYVWNCFIWKRKASEMYGFISTFGYMWIVNLYTRFINPFVFHISPRAWKLERNTFDSFNFYIFYVLYAIPVFWSDKRLYKANSFLCMQSIFPLMICFSRYLNVNSLIFAYFPLMKMLQRISQCE